MRLTSMSGDSYRGWDCLTDAVNAFFESQGIDKYTGTVSLAVGINSEIEPEFAVGGLNVFTNAFDIEDATPARVAEKLEQWACWYDADWVEIEDEPSIEEAIEEYGSVSFCGTMFLASREYMEKMNGTVWHDTDADYSRYPFWVKATANYTCEGYTTIREALLTWADWRR